jgi:ribosomal protein S18 acetylase RimI-like enzyme
MAISASNSPLFLYGVVLVLFLLAFPAQSFSASSSNKGLPRTQSYNSLGSITQLSVVTERGTPAGETVKDDNFFFIRKALPAELGAASDILSEVFFKENTNFLTYQWERLTTYLSLESTYPKPGDRHCLFVACHATDGKVLGLAEIDDRPSKTADATPRPYMFNVAVDPKWRERGIARSLVLECEEIARKEWNKPTVFLKVRDTSKLAVAMYKSLGYKERSNKIERLNDKYQNLIVMSKTVMVDGDDGER